VGFEPTNPCGTGVLMYKPTIFIFGLFLNNPTSVLRFQE